MSNERILGRRAVARKAYAGEALAPLPVAAAVHETAHAAERERQHHRRRREVGDDGDRHAAHLGVEHARRDARDEAAVEDEAALPLAEDAPRIVVLVQPKVEGARYDKREE